MPYRRRVGSGGYVFHVLNRSARRVQLFGRDSDYRAFLDVMQEAQARTPLRLLAYCLMPNHFHLVAWPSRDEELSGFMQWLTATHSKRWNVYRGGVGTGAVYQGRFKAFPIQADGHFLTVCRYVEQNALRARLVSRAEDWPWSSLALRRSNCHDVALSTWPILPPSNWLELVNEVPTEEVLREVRYSIRRHRPFGEQRWTKEAAAKLSLEPGCRGTGRPRSKMTSGVVLRKT
jgi:putative transposase